VEEIRKRRGEHGEIRLNFSLHEFLSLKNLFNCLHFYPNFYNKNYYFRIQPWTDKD